MIKPIETQWIEKNAKVTTQSFLDINQQTVEIDKTKRYMIEKKHTPAIITTRAIVNKTRKHTY